MNDAKDYALTIVDAIERQDGEAAAAAVRNVVAPLIAALEKSG